MERIVKHSYNFCLESLVLNILLHLLPLYAGALFLEIKEQGFEPF